MFEIHALWFLKLGFDILLLLFWWLHSNDIAIFYEKLFQIVFPFLYLLCWNSNPIWCALCLYKFWEVIMLRNIYQKNFKIICFKMVSFIKHLVWTHHLKIVFLKERRHLETTKALIFLMQVPKHLWVSTVSTACFLINRMPSSFLSSKIPFSVLLPNKALFPIEPRIFGCTCFVRDVQPQVTKLDPISLKCIFLGYSRVQGISMLLS